MMRWIVGSSLKLRRLVVAAAVGLVIAGLMQVGKTPVDALPEFSPPRVEVQTEALGLSAAEVEELITAPLEQDLLVGIPFLDEIESVSLPGLSSVVMIFEPGTDLLDARQVVQERLTQAVGVAGLPAVAKTPQMIQPLSSTGRVSMVKLTSEELTPIEMSVLARWVVGPRLLGVPGVANVSIWGNRDRQLQVLVEPEKLQERGVTLAQVIRTAGNSLEVSPLSFLEASTPGTGGFIDTPNQRLNIFHEQTISSPEELAQVPLEGPDGGIVDKPGADTPTTLGDVATVVEAHQPLIGDAACGDGSGCLLMVVEKFPGANTAAVAGDVDAALAALQPGLADMQLDSSVYRPASYIGSSFNNLGWALLVGGLLTLLLLMGFFADWRRALIVAASLVVSLATAVVVLNALGTTVNLLVVAGLVLGLTAVVDDVVNHVDQVGIRVRHHRESMADGHVWTEIVRASTGVHRSLLYATLVLVAAALPLFFLSETAGAFLPTLALSYLLAAGISMLVVLTLTPALAMLLLTTGSLGRRQSPVVGWLRRRYDRSAPGMVGRTGVALTAFGVIAALGLGSAFFLDASFRPGLKERDVLVQVQAPAGTSLPRMTTLTEEMVTAFGDLPGVVEANGQIGRAVMSDQTVDVNQGEVWVSIAEDADYDATMDSLRAAAADFDEVTTAVKTYSDERVQQVLEAQRRDVAVRVYGADPEALNAKADEIQAMLAGVDGVRNPVVDRAEQAETLEVHVDLDRAQALGMKPGDVRRAASSLLGGITVGNLFEAQKVFDVVVWGAPGIRSSNQDLRALMIDTPDGRGVRLGDVADLRRVSSDSVIRHESAARFVEVTADVAGRDVADVNRDVAAAVKELTFPLDHHAEVMTDFADRDAAGTRLLAIAVAAALAIFLLLQSAFRSWRLAAVAVVTLPVSLSGGLVAALVTGGTLTLGTVIGLVAVLGLATRGLILLVRHYQHLERKEGMAFGPDLVVTGTGDRLAPTLLSALAAIALLAPVAVLGSPSGLEVLHPAVVALIGGLVTTTLVNLVVVPLVYLRLGSVPDHDSWADELYEDVPEFDLA